MNNENPSLVPVEKLTLEFAKVKNEISAAYIAVGMTTDSMYDFFIRNATNAKIFSLITGIHMPTPPSVLRKIKQRVDENKMMTGIYLDEYFHPKFYLFKLNDAWLAFVGSGNFTDGGWFKNKELFIKITDQSACADLKKTYDQWFAASEPLTDRLITLYEETFPANERRNNENNRNLSSLKDALHNTFNIDNINFAGQFFSKEHHLAFQPGKTHLDTEEVLLERTLVRNRLYDLNERLVPHIPQTWQIYHHYEPEHIVAHIETNFHHNDNVKALWVGYGRNRDALKKYGEVDTTPLNFMRMQVIVRYTDVGIWLMPGKAGAGRMDREFFLRNIQNDQTYLIRFHTLLSALGDQYWIDVAGSGESIKVNSFETQDALKAFLLTDNWRHYYFTIGRNYVAGSDELTNDQIVTTIIDDFSRLYPLYEMIRDKSFG